MSLDIAKTTLAIPNAYTKKVGSWIMPRGQIKSAGNNKSAVLNPAHQIDPPWSKEGSFRYSPIHAISIPIPHPRRTSSRRNAESG